MTTRISKSAICVLLSAAISACGGGGGGGGESPTTPTPTPTTYTIGGSVSGLEGSGLTLQNNGADDLDISADGSFTFATAINSGTSYDVRVLTQPSGPIQECSVANSTGTANANVTNVMVSCETPSTSVDSDNDGLTDAQEVAIGTSPELEDTDGDGLSDGFEVNNGGFNPLVADLPKVEIEVVGDPSIQINVVDTDTGAQVTSVSATYERGQENSFARSDTESTSATIGASTRIYSEAEASVSPTAIGGSAKTGTESSVSASVTQEQTTSISRTSASNSRQEFARLQDETRSATRVTSGGSLGTALRITNTSDLSFEISGLDVIANRRSGQQGAIALVGELQVEPGTTQVLGPGESFLDVVDRQFQDAGVLEALLADPSGLQFTVGSFAMTNIGGDLERNWGTIAQDVNSKTAQIVIDYGDNDPRSNGETVERYQVATNVARDAVTNEVIGISMRDVLSNSLEIPYTVVSSEIIDANGQPTGVFREVLSEVRGVQTASIEQGFWYVFTSSASADEPAIDFEDLIMMPGDRISMVYMRDQDLDEIFDREEFLLGTSAIEEDTDGDGLSDYQEARQGWAVSVDGDVRRVFSDPLNQDSDGDTWTDLQEFNNGTDPDRADTDNDGVADNLDPNPTGPDRVSFTAEFFGPERSFRGFFQAVASGGADRNITRLTVDWGDGSPVFEKVCAPCSNSIEADLLHIYATEGLFTVTVTADVESAPSETKQYQVGVQPRFSADIGLSANSGWNEANDTRLIADVNSDGMDDIVGFGPDGTYVALSNGTGFDVALKQFDDLATGTGFDKQVERRLLAQVSGSIEPDIVVFATDGVYIALNDGNGQFSMLCGGNPCVEDYAFDQGYTSFALNPRYLSDMTGDGLADIVAFSDGGVIIAQSAQVTFTDPNPGEFAIRRFGPASGGWTEEAVRILADVNGDGSEDIVGFGFSQTAYARARPDRNPPLFSNTETYNDLLVASRGWRSIQNPRLGVDINGDGLDDVFGYANEGLVVSYARSTDVVPNGGLTATLQTLSDDFGFNDGWQFPNAQRHLADVNGDGFLDIVGFGPNPDGGAGGTFYALNPGNGGRFGSTNEWVSDFSLDRGYTYNLTPRFMGDVNGDGNSDIIVFDNSSVEVVFALSASE